MTTKDRMALQELFEKTEDTDCLRDMIEFAAQRLMDLEVEGQCTIPIAAGRRCGLRDCSVRLTPQKTPSVPFATQKGEDSTFTPSPAGGRYPLC